MESAKRPDIQEDIAQILSEFDDFLDSVFEVPTLKPCSKATDLSRQRDQTIPPNLPQIKDSDSTVVDEEVERVRNFESAKAFFSGTFRDEPHAEGALYRAQKCDDVRFPTKSSEFAVKTKTQPSLIPSDICRRAATNQQIVNLVAKSGESRDSMVPRGSVATSYDAEFSNNTKPEIINMDKDKAKTTSGIADSSLEPSKTAFLDNKWVSKESPIPVTDEDVCYRESNKNNEFKNEMKEMPQKNERIRHSSEIMTDADEKPDRGFFTKSLEKLNSVGKNMEKTTSVSCCGINSTIKEERKPGYFSSSYNSLILNSEPVKNVEIPEKSKKNKKYDKISTLQKLLCTSSHKNSDMDKEKVSKSVSVSNLDKVHISQPVLTSTTVNLQTRETTEIPASTSTQMESCLPSEINEKYSQTGSEFGKITPNVYEPYARYFYVKPDMSAKLKRMNREHFSVDNKQLLKFDDLIREFNTKPRYEALSAADRDASSERLPTDDSKTKLLATPFAGGDHHLRVEDSGSKSKEVMVIDSSEENTNLSFTAHTLDAKKNANISKYFKNEKSNKDLKKEVISKDMKVAACNKPSKLKSLWLSASPAPYASIFNNKSSGSKKVDNISSYKYLEEILKKRREEDKVLSQLHNFLSTYSAKIAAGIMSVEHRGTKALELWTRRATEGYPGVNITNMTTAWRDGLAFCALIHHFRPDLIDIKSLKPENILENNALAFRVAEQHLGIPALLDAEDMVQTEVPDRLSILTYVSQFYQAFSALGLIGPGGRRSPVAANNIKNTEGTSTTPVKTSPVVASPKAKSISQPPPTLQTKTEQTGFKTDKVTAVARGRREECVACHKTVFLAERIVVGFPGQLRHRTCFRCDRCSTQLTLASYYETEKRQFCCETCPDEERPVSSGEEEETAEVVSPSLQPGGEYYSSDSDSQSDSDSAAASESEEDSSPLRPTTRTEATERSHSSSPPHPPTPRTVFLHSALELSSPPSKPPRNDGLSPPSTHFQSLSPALCGSDPPPPTECIEVSDSSGHIQCDDAKGQETLPPGNTLDTGQEVRNNSSPSIPARGTLFEKSPSHKIAPKIPENNEELKQLKEKENIIGENKLSKLKKIFETPNTDAHVQPPIMDISEQATVQDKTKLASPFEREETIPSTPKPSYLKEKEPSVVSPSLNSVNSSLKSPDSESIVPEVTKPPISHYTFNTQYEESFNSETTTQRLSTQDNKFVLPDEFEEKLDKERDAIEKKDKEIEKKVNKQVTISDKANEIVENVPLIPAEKSDAEEIKKEEDTFEIKETNKIEKEVYSIEKDGKKDLSEMKVEDMKEITPEKSDQVIEAGIEESENIKENVTEFKITRDLEEVIERKHKTKEEPEFTIKEDDIKGIKEFTEKTNENTTEVVDKEIKSEVPNKEIQGMKEKVITVSDERSKLEPSNDAKDEHPVKSFYPDELNPFGSDEEEPKVVSDITKEVDTKDDQASLKVVETKKVIKAPVNPFESDDEETRKSPQTLNTTETTPAKKSLNPFWSDDEESDSASSSSKGKSKPPRPPPPTLKRDVVPVTKKLILPYPPCDPISKPNPPSPTPSARSSSSDQSTLRLKKKMRQAPAPPSARSSPARGKETPTNEEVSLSKEDGLKDDALAVKMQKDLKNHTSKMMLKSGVAIPKSESGEWRRKKGPAPSRPVPQKRAIRKLPMRQVQQELHDIEVKQTELERQGVLLETAIRDRTERGIIPSSSDESGSLHSFSNNSEGDRSCSSSSSCYPGMEVEDMILQLFELVNEKNELFRRQTELMYMKREKRLEEEYAELEYQIRCLMLKPPSERTEADTKHEEDLIGRLVKVVEQRDAVVNCLEMERQREAIENESIATHMIKYQEKHIEGIESDEEKDLTKKKKKKLRLLKKKKKKGKEKEKSSKIDADKDVDETEVKKKKKNWFKRPIPSSSEHIGPLRKT